MHDAGFAASIFIRAIPAPSVVNNKPVNDVVNAAGRALYFSRRTIPYLRDKAGQASRLSSERESVSGKKRLSHRCRAGFRQARRLPYVGRQPRKHSGTVGGVSFFETSRHLRIPAEDVVAVGKLSRVAVGRRGETGAVARVGKRRPDRRRESGLRQRGGGCAGRRGAGGETFA
jgi:hypothetical protein